MASPLPSDPEHSPLRDRPSSARRRVTFKKDYSPRPRAAASEADQAARASGRATCPPSADSERSTRPSSAASNASIPSATPSHLPDADLLATYARFLDEADTGPERDACLKVIMQIILLNKKIVASNAEENAAREVLAAEDAKQGAMAAGMGAELHSAPEVEKKKTLIKRESGREVQRGGDDGVAVSHACKQERMNRTLRMTGATPTEEPGCERGLWDLHLMRSLLQYPCLPSPALELSAKATSSKFPPKAYVVCVNWIVLGVDKLLAILRWVGGILLFILFPEGSGRVGGGGLLDVADDGREMVMTGAGGGSGVEPTSGPSSNQRLVEPRLDLTATRRRLIKKESKWEGEGRRRRETPGAHSSRPEPTMRVPTPPCPPRERPSSVSRRSAVEKEPPAAPGPHSAASFSAHASAASDSEKADHATTHLRSESRYPAKDAIVKRIMDILDEEMNVAAEAEARAVQAAEEARRKTMAMAMGAGGSAELHSAPAVEVWSLSPTALVAWGISKLMFDSMLHDSKKHD
ncbi:hypothetical protein BDK51DRAFT_48212 [Blyttiomyces helicus]|uniref:Uncharacterized protein n=1 Tax=Blyttiomyces helicus TaxID=388810 RepID=A0A4V1IQ21_9FUNG|nr:hypothetical protein BDK51DRAFT_48212 [Blyttiomyces helicus]|eukprot:RKO85037.1 hypothetical protein BDK51DRAFT_48212 [Blyttiomyces helicus]